MMLDSFLGYSNRLLEAESPSLAFEAVLSELIQIETPRISSLWERFVAGDEVDLSSLQA